MKLGSSRGMDTKRPRGSERSKPCHQLRLTRLSQPPHPWPPEQAQPGVSKPCRTTREVAYIPRGQFESAPAVVGVCYRLSGLERLLAISEGALERTEARLGHKIGVHGNRPRRQAHFLCGLRAFLPDKRNAHCRPSFKTDIYVAMKTSCLLQHAPRPLREALQNWRAATAA